MASYIQLLQLTAAYLLILSLPHKSTACTKDQIPATCKCMDEVTIQCSHLMTFPNITNTKAFFFVNCDFQTIGGTNMPKYELAEVFSLTACKVETIEDDVFTHFAATLKQLEMDGNFFDTISKDALNLPYLTNLVMQHNALKRLPSDMLSMLPALKELSLSHNKHIDTLPEDLFLANKQLVHVDISFCNFTYLPSELSKLPNLHTLGFAGNKLGPLKADMFKDVPHLEYLDIAACSANTIDPEAFNGMHKLNQLRLSSNDIGVLPRDAFSHIRGTLLHIWLDHNILVTLENGTLPVNRLKEIHLGHNPWRCDEKIVWFKDLHLDKIDHENVTCATPKSLVSLSVANVTREMFLNASDDTGQPMLAAAIIIPIIVICLLVIFFTVLKLYQSRKNQKRTQIRYSAVYKDTVESSKPGHPYRPTSDI